MSFNKLISRVPTIVIFTALVVSFASNFIDFNYVVAGNTIGYSLFFNICFIYFLHRLKYCIHTKLAMFNLTILNIFNIMQDYELINYNDYCLTYEITTTSIMFIALVVYYIKKKKQNKVPN